MSAFEAAIPTVMAHEGGWVHDPDDLGGETNFGWSTKTIRELGLSILPRELTKARAEELYREHFWDRYGYGAILSQTSATKVFDCAVNCGPRRAATLAQAVVAVVQDGVLGPVTINAINTLGADFVPQYGVAMASYYRAIAVARPANAKFLGNWLHRAAWSG